MIHSRAYNRFVAEEPMPKITLTLMPGGVLKCEWFPSFDGTVGEQEKPVFMAMLNEAARLIVMPTSKIASASPVIRA